MIRNTLLLSLLCNFFLSGCANTYVQGINIVGVERRVVIKRTEFFNICKPIYSSYEGLNSKYLFSVRCKFEGGVVPDSFNITYAIWPYDEIGIEEAFGEKIWKYEANVRNKYIDKNGNILDEDEWLRRGINSLNKKVARLPESAWQTYTVDIESRLEKYKGKTPDGKPMGIVIPIGWGIYNPSLFPSLKDRTLNLNIIIDKNGNVEVEEDYRWEHELPDNPYA